MSWEAGRQRRAAAQTAMMKTDVKLQEMAKARTVSTCIREPGSSSNTPSIMLSAPLLVMIYSEAPQQMLCHANRQQRTRLLFLAALMQRGCNCFPSFRLTGVRRNSKPFVLACISCVCVCVLSVLRLRQTKNTLSGCMHSYTAL